MVATEIRPQTDEATGALILHPPSDEDFFDGDFIAEPALQNLADLLTVKHHLPARNNVTVLWKRKGGKSGGKITMGKCSAAQSGLLGWFCPTEFAIWIAADHCREQHLASRQIEAIVFHELLHIEAKEDEKSGEITLSVVGHDWTGFNAELDAYGAWSDDLARAKAHFEQAALL